MSDVIVRYVVAALGLCAVTTSACASRSTGARTDGTTSSSRATTSLAATPQLAAIGFSRSVRGGHDLEFECIPQHSLSFLYSTSDPKVAPTATARRVGDVWHVTVTRGEDDLNPERYEVSRQDTGYCVSKLLPDPPRPPETTSSYPGTGTHLPSYPQTGTYPPSYTASSSGR